MTTVGPRGRVTIPATIQRAAGIKEGDEVIIHTPEPGRIIVETRQAVIDRIRAGIPKGIDPDSLDAVAEIRALRDNRQED